jgi:hypothetical protein
MYSLPQKKTKKTKKTFFIVAYGAPISDIGAPFFLFVDDEKIELKLLGSWLVGNATYCV